MSFFELIQIERMKAKRSGILPLLFIAPLLVVISGIANLRVYLTPEYTNAWAAMFIQSALLYAYYLLPLSMVVVCVMLTGRETQHRGMFRMLTLPVNHAKLCTAKFCVLILYLLGEVIIFFICFLAAGLWAVSVAGVKETMPLFSLIGWAFGLFMTMLPSLALMWAITVCFDRPAISIGLNLLLVIPGLLVAATPLWFTYPYCYSGYLVSCSLHAYTSGEAASAFSLWPFLHFALGFFALSLWMAVWGFGKKELRG